MRDVSAELRTGPRLVLAAYHQLADEGLVELRARSGIFVRAEQPRMMFARPGRDVVDGQLISDLIQTRLLVEPYLVPGLRTEDFAPVAVPEGQLFVMGDNRKPNMSRDSRSFGPIETSSIVGRVIVRVWPVGNASWL